MLREQQYQIEQAYRVLRRCSRTQFALLLHLLRRTALICKRRHDRP
jgi:hypothetical protein